MTNNNSSHSSFFYLIIGVFLGGIIALLLAPKKGKDFRKSILSFLDALQEKGANKLKNTSQEEIYKENRNSARGDDLEDNDIKIKEIINN